VLINPRNFHYLPLHHAIAWVTPEAGETAKPRSQLTLRRLAERTRLSPSLNGLPVVNLNVNSVFSRARSHTDGQDIE